MFTTFSASDASALISLRQGETKLGERVTFLEGHPTDANTLTQSLLKAKQQGVRFALIGVTEDIGPRANLGRGGAQSGFSAALSQWLNLQSNRFLNGSECIVLGSISPDKSVTSNETFELRQATSDLDNEVIYWLSAVFEAGIEPIVIGGGHNNAFGLLTAAKTVFEKPMAAVNLDPHSDFRPKEGRHSGNGFSYAAANGALDHYHILGLHELKNSEQTLEQLSLFGASWHSFQQIWVRREISLTDALKQIAKDLKNTNLPVGLELDVDAIAQMPSSASTFAGISLIDACQYVHHISRTTPTAYLHLAEAAPECHAASMQAGMRDTGQALSELIYAYIQGRSASNEY